LLTVSSAILLAGATELHAMGSPPTWAAWSVITAVLLLSPALAFLMVIAMEILIDFLMEIGVTTLLAVAIGAIGWFLFRKRSSRAKVASLLADDEQVLDEPAIAAPST